MIEDVKGKSNNIISLDLSETARTKIWVNGDNTKVLELNLSDVGIISRLENAQNTINDLVAEVRSLSSADIPDGDPDGVMAKSFSKMNDKMCEIVDGIFDYPVCEICCDGGSMFDPIGGQMRFEYIIDKLSNLYTDTITEEMKRIQAKMDKHTAKYTKPTTKKRK